MNDILAKMGKSQVQHGKWNDRVYLMKLSPDDVPGIIPRLDQLCKEKGYGKIFAKVPQSLSDAFFSRGFSKEAEIPQFYKGEETALFLGKYYSEERRKEPESKVAHCLESLKNSAPNIRPLAKVYHVQQLESDHVQNMAAVYRKVFASYPFPIDDPKYLESTMSQSTIYFGIWHGQDLIALSSAEMDLESENAEMTDFAVLPQFRGQSLAYFLLQTMENVVKSHGIRTVYTIARLESQPMNRVFYHLDYRYGGTLINNTNIGGGLESMNVWYKAI